MYCWNIQVQTINKDIICLWVLASFILIYSNLCQAESIDFRLRSNQLYYQNTTTVDDVRAEIRFGQNIAARILGRIALYDDNKINRYVSLVGHTLTQFSNRSELTFFFAVLDSLGINAYSTPGGYVFITKGALQIMQDESELAAVLAHEIAHITERHIVKEFNIKGVDSSAISSISQIIGGNQDTVRIAFSQAVDQAMSVLFEKGYKQQDELISDKISTLLIAATGYDPMALQRYLTRVQELTEDSQINESKTHPPTEQRAKSLNQFINKEKLTELLYPTAKKRFMEFIGSISTL